MQIILPWPPTLLNPNSIAHWGKKARAKKAYYTWCWACAKEVRPRFPDGKIKFYITFIPPVTRRRDEDNLIASMKSGFDGIAKAWGIDDSRFSFIVSIEAAQKPGRVLLETAYPVQYTAAKGSVRG